MAGVLGGDDGKQKLGSGGDDEQIAAGNGSLEHMVELGSRSDDDAYYNNKHFGEAFDWQSSSPSSTREMLRGHVDRSVNSSSSDQRRSSSRRFRIVEWGSVWDKSREWIRSPVNMALLVWIVAVAVSGAILFMVMTGMLNRALPQKTQRDTWFEVNNQILNALFTLMCLYQHPRRFYHLALLCRWRPPADMLHLREAYCKDAACKPNERKHMAVVVMLLHLNCFAQYALCGLNLGYSRPNRPPVGVGLTISVAICAPAVAGLYNNLSPLGKDYEASQPQPEEQGDEESQGQQLQRKTTSALHDQQPQWVGGLFELWDEDLSLAYLSVFCSCCVFGWNMSRLGFGNMYVHVVTFILFCLAPFFIFNLAAINIDNEGVRDALGLGGILLCVLGLLYGGFWRIQMRRRFNLPASHACCGKPDLTDCLQWLCCYSCSLAQEVRTADAYQVLHDTRRTTCHHHTTNASSISSTQTTIQMQHHPTLQEELSTMQQPLRFAGVFATPPSVPVAARSLVDHRVTVPPSVSVIPKH